MQGIPKPAGSPPAARYLVLLYYNPFKMQAKVDAKVKREDIERLKKKLLGQRAGLAEV